MKKWETFTANYQGPSQPGSDLVNSKRVIGQHYVCIQQVNILPDTICKISQEVFSVLFCRSNLRQRSHSKDKASALYPQTYGVVKAHDTEGK